jgi:hypothetical protein
MSFLAGDLLTAQRLNRLAPKTYHVKSSGTLPASSSGVDIPGATYTFTTETDGATVDVFFFVDFDNTASPGTSVGSVRALLDGATGGTLFGIYGANITDGRSTIGNQDQFIVPTAGSHTIKLTATTPVAMTVNQYTSLKLVVSEVV